MKSIFELKNSLPFDSDIFEQMRKTALELLVNAEKKEYTQAIVLLSRAGNEYSAVIEDALLKDKSEEKDLIERLVSANDSTLSLVLCMWQDGSVDLPSFALRQMLLDIDPSNKDCGLFVMTADGGSVMSLGNTMK